MKELPEFAARVEEEVYAYVSRVFKRGDDTMLIRLDAYDDGHYRAVFDIRYFALHEGHTEPTKSQWNTLKKHMKRVDKAVFVFKEHGFTPEGYCYVDFGFFAN